MYDFSRVSIHQIERLHDCLLQITPLANTSYTIGGMTTALDVMTYSHSLQMSTETRAEFAELYAKIALVTDFDVYTSKLRLYVIEWLEMNDRNGCYSDCDRLAEGHAPMAIDAALRCAHAALIDDQIEVSGL